MDNHTDIYNLRTTGMDSYDRFIAAAQQAKADGNLETAICHCDAAVALNPERTVAYYLLAAICLGIENGVGLVIENMTKVAFLTPEDLQVRLDLGSLYLSIKNHQSAETSYLAALDIDPFCVEAIVNLGTFYRQHANSGDIPMQDQFTRFVVEVREKIDRLRHENRIKEAVSISSALLAFTPETPGDLNDHAVLSHMCGKDIDARLAIDSAIALAPEDVVIQKNSRRIFAVSGLAPPGYSLLKRGQRGETERLNRLGRKNIEAEKWVDAENCFKEILAMRSRSFDAAFGLFSALLGQGKRDEAIVALKKCADIEPENREVADRLARLLADALSERFSPEKPKNRYTFGHAAWNVGTSGFSEMTPAVIIAFQMISHHNPDLSLAIFDSGGVSTYPWEIIEILGGNDSIDFFDRLPSDEDMGRLDMFVYPAIDVGLKDRIDSVSKTGIPVIASADLGAEFIRPGKNGLLVGTVQNSIGTQGQITLDLNDLASKMFFIACDPSLAADMSGKTESGVLNPPRKASFNYPRFKSSYTQSLSRPATYQRICMLYTHYPKDYHDVYLISHQLQKMGFVVENVSYRQNREKLPEIIQNMNADLVIVERGDGIPPELIDSLPCPAILLNGEYMWGNDDAARERLRDVRGLATVFDYALRLGEDELDYMELLRNFGCNRIGYSYPCRIDPAIYRKLDLPKKYDVSFIGTLTPRRKSILEQLSRRFNVEFRNIWDLKEQVRFFNESKIVLHMNFAPYMSTNAVNIRTMDVMACGTLMMHEDPVFHKMFKDGEHIVYWRYNDIDDLAAKIEYYLNHKDERERIAAAGKCAVEAKFSVEKSILDLMDHIDFTIRAPRLKDSGYGVARDKFGRPTMSLNDLFKAVEPLSHTRYPHSHYKRGEIYLELGLFDKAAVCFEKAVEMDVQNRDALLKLGLTYRALNRPKAAIRELRRVLKMDLFHAQTNLVLGELYFRIGEPEEAELYIQRGKKLLPKEVLAGMEK